MSVRGRSAPAIRRLYDDELKYPRPAACSDSTRGTEVARAADSAFEGWRETFPWIPATHSLRHDGAAENSCGASAEVYCGDDSVDTGVVGRCTTS